MVGEASLIHTRFDFFFENIWSNLSRKKNKMGNLSFATFLVVTCLVGLSWAGTRSSRLSRFSTRNLDARAAFGCDPVPVCDPTHPYRTINGTCNNLHNPLWGASFTLLRRTLPAVYADSNGTPLGSEHYPTLPGPREVSVASSISGSKPSTADASLMVMQWGQFIDHDLGFAPEFEDEHCCEDGYDNTTTNPECLPIDVSQDIFFSQFGRVCIHFTRSVPADPSCGGGVREQVNELTAYIDGSQVYGSTPEEEQELRAFNYGKLKAGPGFEPVPNGVCPNICPLLYLPVRQNAGGDNEFFAGDRRAQEQPGLTSIHTLFVRVHNHIAQTLCKRSRNQPTDEICFQEARRIVSALIQHITYNEFLPIVLGNEAMGTYKLFLKQPFTDLYETRYIESIDPSITNIFTAAAFRFGHSLIKDVFNLNGYIVKLAESFNLHERTVLLGSLPSDFLRGLGIDQADKMDHFMVETLTNRLFAEGPSFSHGSDLMARNVLRGRDHGLQGYNAWRQECGLHTIKSFTELAQVMDPKAALAFSKVYRSVDDLDIFPAMIAETSVGGGLVGPTLTCIMGRQFKKLKFGDRFWYENDVQPRPFTIDQLNSIKTTALSTLICAYTQNTQLNFESMRISQPGNRAENCTSILEAGLPRDILHTSIWDF